MSNSRVKRRERGVRRIGAVFMATLIVSTLLLAAYVALRIARTRDVRKAIQESRIDRPVPEEALPLDPDCCKRGRGEVPPEAILIPGCECVADGHRVRLEPFRVAINADGFRDRAFSREKPAGTKRIVVVGDSITFGEGVEADATYAKVLERRLNENGTDPFEVLNMGVPGFDLAEKVAMLANKGVSYDPDLVILQYCGDDFVREARLAQIVEAVTAELRAEGALDGLSDREAGVLIHEEARNVRYEREIKSGFDAIWAAALEEEIRALVDLAEKHRFRVVLLLWPGPGKQSRLWRELAVKQGWRVVDLTPIYEEHGWPALSVHPKDNHPNVRAHALYADRLAKEMTGLF